MANGDSSRHQGENAAEIEDGSNAYLGGIFLLLL